jgi:hypothetical protein
MLSRVAYHISRQLSDADNRNIVRERTGIHERTLRRYAAYNLDKQGRLDVKNGPRKTEILLQICAALSENAGLVLWAAMTATSYPEMLTLLQSPLYVRPAPGLMRIAHNAAQVQVPSPFVSEGDEATRTGRSTDGLLHAANA